MHTFPFFKVISLNRQLLDRISFTKITSHTAQKEKLLKNKNLGALKTIPITWHCSLQRFLPGGPLVASPPLAFALHALAKSHSILQDLFQVQ
jgi:hypothetical protein